MSRGVHVVTTLLLVGVLAGSAAAAIVIREGAAAWAEIQASFESLRKVTGYRLKVTASMTPVVVEVVNPDRLRWKFSTPGGSVHWIVVGKEARTREGDGAWKCAPVPAYLRDIDPARWTGEVTAAKGAPGTIDGVRVRSYTYAIHTPRTAVWRLYIDLGTGLPKRLQGLAVKENEPDTVIAQFDLFDVNAPITIDLPACR